MKPGVFIFDSAHPKLPRLSFYPGVAETGPIGVTVVCSSLEGFRQSFSGGLLERFAERHFVSSNKPARFRRYTEPEMEALRHMLSLDQNARCETCGGTVEAHDWFFSGDRCPAYRAYFVEPFERLNLPQFMMFQGDVFDVLERYRNRIGNRHILGEMQAAIREVSWEWFQEGLASFAPKVTLTLADSDISVHFGFGIPMDEIERSAMIEASKPLILALEDFEDDQDIVQYLRARGYRATRTYDSDIDTFDLLWAHPRVLEMNERLNGSARDLGTTWFHLYVRETCWRLIVGLTGNTLRLDIDREIPCSNSI